MLHKFRTNVLNAAFKASSKLPPQVQRVVEHDLLVLIQIYSTSMERGKHEAFWSYINDYCKREVIELADRLRDTQGRCTRCGSRDHDASIH